MQNTKQNLNTGCNIHIMKADILTEALIKKRNIQQLT